ncbi:MAG TPA: S8 family serine peptidase [Candidatus Tectomicrobia bacterium]|nr:S8 family serine peptidase [Candidatus Tectomicrobia bacterium]
MALLLGLGPVGTGGASTGETKRHLVVFAGDYAVDSTYAVGGGYAVVCQYAVLNGYAVTCDYAVAHEYAVTLVEAAGGTVASDLFGQIGVLVVDSANAAFAQLLSGYAVVEAVGRDYAAGRVPGGGPEQTADPLEATQWGMALIRAPQAHGVQAGARAVDVGVLDTGIDGAHLDFQDVQGGTNVDCLRGRDSLAGLPPGVAVSNPVPCVDNGFHGTHVAGIIAAQANGHGVVGVAPNVTLVPIKVCDSTGFCYASAVVDGITYAGDEQLDVINMSFFVDDDEFQESTEFKCTTDPEQRAFRKAVERAVQYARNRGVTPVAALGNSDADLANPPAGNNCDVVPAETPGVIGVAALGNRGQKASYSNYGSGAVDVAAPGGTSTGDPRTGVLSTVPGNTWAAFSGTSMASPHAAGVAALVVSQHGTLGTDGDVKLSPTSVESLLQGTAVDQGLSGYDECFGNGRVDALRAVTKQTAKAYDAAAPFCPEYDE